MEMEDSRRLKTPEKLKVPTGGMLRNLGALGVDMVREGNRKGRIWTLKF
ncbi:hypothetical protein CCACVL1_10793 [Corchorus capsularis]|uniref:Uncharacterized protein n=1 Tax=Corchorus capsularis TaxID=210143 RepID=A0A1R3IPL4_COCAP|nr:hypothetical protein CCACVL1_10793 [Corchorus capsularis]